MLVSNRLELQANKSQAMSLSQVFTNLRKEGVAQGARLNTSQKSMHRGPFQPRKSHFADNYIQMQDAESNDVDTAMKDE